MVTKGIIDPNLWYTLSGLYRALGGSDVEPGRTALRRLRERLDRCGVGYSVLLQHRVYRGKDVLEGCWVEAGAAKESAA